MKLLNEEQKQETTADEVLQLTALLYFQEALLNEEYESCQELVDIARGFGVQSSDIKQVIAAVFPKSKAGGLNEANPKKNRLRLLKEDK